MPAWEYVVKQRLKIGQDEWLEAGEITLLPNTWHPSALRAHLNIGAIEKARLLPDVSYEEPAPASYAPEGYDELTPTPGPVVGERSPSAGHRELSCTNCRSAAAQTLNYVPQDAARFECWLCHQQQSVQDALNYPSQGWDDWQRAGFRQGGR